MMRVRQLFFMLMLVLAVQAHARVKPVPSPHDPHFQSVPYTHEIVDIIVRPGKFAEIQFHPDETDILYGIGDRDAWTIKVAGNLFAFKPKAAFADTNLKIWSPKTKRVYWFNVIMARRPQTAELWHLDIDYPPDPPKPPPAPNPEVVALQLAVQEKNEVERRLGGGPQYEVEPVEARSERTLNGNYGIIGPEELQPTSVYDNGEQTVLTFAPNNPMPSIFVKESDGTETIVPKHVENDMLIVHRVAKRFVLRHNGKVACLINGSFSPTGPNNKTKTISDSVIRETRKAN
ncbi:MAG TPA: TrbG/VirB9 family P-type conjugative transfer protein [Noviherbaspirillum sp.]|nr:TrbG/VirB9 family P-type conjugative transfer protein [Noviherbaspirillum sp.]